MLALKSKVKATATRALTWLSGPQAQALLGQDYTPFSRRSQVLIDAGYREFSAMIMQVCTRGCEARSHGTPPLR
jgi:hypothetical protein